MTAEARARGGAAGVARGVALALLALGGAAPASGASFSDVYFFGDSLSDSGNLCAAIDSFEPRYAPGRCSNGPVWSEQLASALGHDAAPSQQGGDNYAMGGARAVGGSVDLAGQIDNFEGSAEGATGADADALYALWLGGNDVLATPEEPELEELVGAVVDGMERLHENTGPGGAGARHFLVPNLPDIGRTYGDFDFEGEGEAWDAEERAERSALTQAWNQELALQLGELGPGYAVYTVDVFDYLEDLVENPEDYGVAEAALDTGSGGTEFLRACLADEACRDASPEGGFPADGTLPERFVLFDGIHPTTAAHGEIAERALAAVPEPGAAALVGLGVGLLSAARTRRARRA